MNPITIAGAGVAGMTAALTLASHGYPVKIFEKEKAIGNSRHGDFEGIENWIFSQSPEKGFLNAGFPWHQLDQTPIHEFLVHIGNEKPLTLYSPRPFFHMIRRGNGEKDLDTFLYQSCLEHHVEFIFSSQAPEGADILATGSQKASAYIQGLSFSTNLPDQVHLLLGKRFAPKGYAYLIILKGQGTLATAFKKTEDSSSALDKTQQYFQARGIPIPQGTSFASRGSFSRPQKSNWSSPFKIGESGGFQDFLFGFGIRMAMESGRASAKKILGQNSEARRILREINRKRKLSYLNRILYERLSDNKMAGLAEKLSESRNPLGILEAAYTWNFKTMKHWYTLNRSS